MKLFKFRKSKACIGGSIGYFGLDDWWLTEFSDEERRYIQAKFRPLGSQEDSLTSGTISYSSGTAVSLLTALAGWFSKPQDRAIAHKILNKALVLSKGGPVLTVHYLYQQMIETYYKDRDQLHCKEKAVEACKQQIALAPDAAKAFKTENANSPLPGHKGYEQLAIILEKAELFEDMITLCGQAESQGWAGDWARRVERVKKKSLKLR